MKNKYKQGTNQHKRKRISKKQREWIKKQTRFYSYLIIALLAYGGIVWHVAIELHDMQEYDGPHFLSMAHAQEINEDKMEMREWVLWRTEQAGMDPVEVAMVIQAESRWNPLARNVNNNHTVDEGLWQLNTIHNISPHCTFDYKCATEEAIKLYEKQGWRPWYGARAVGLW